MIAGPCGNQRDLEEARGWATAKEDKSKEGRQEGGRGVKEHSHTLRNDEYTHHDAESRPQTTCMRSGGAARWQTA
jgi:hypothetical protein